MKNMLHILYSIRYTLKKNIGKKVFNLGPRNHLAMANQRVGQQKKPEFLRHLRSQILVLVVVVVVVEGLQAVVCRLVEHGWRPSLSLLALPRALLSHLYKYKINQ